MFLLRTTSARFWVLALSCFAASAIAVGAARADEERVHLRYRASGPCAGRDGFVADVGARTPRARWVANDQGVRIFEVQVEADPEQGEQYSQTVGTLTIVDTDGSVSTRRVEGDSCDEVLSALALIAALAIDPRAKVTPTPGPTTHVPETLFTPSAPVEASSSPAPAGTIPPPAATPSAPVVSSLPGGSPPPVAWNPPPYRPVPRRERWRWAVGAQPAATSALGTPMSFTMAVYLDLALEREQLVAPAFRLAISFLPTRSFELAEGSAEVIRLAAHPVGCPIRVELLEDVALQPCLGAQIGMLRASGKVDPERDSTSLWLALATPVRLQWTPLDWALIEARGALGVPFIRQRFYFEPDRTVLTVPPVFGTIGGSFAVRF